MFTPGEGDGDDHEIKRQDQDDDVNGGSAAPEDQARQRKADRHEQQDRQDDFPAAQQKDAVEQQAQHRCEQDREMGGIDPVAMPELDEFENAESIIICPRSEQIHIQQNISHPTKAN